MKFHLIGSQTFMDFSPISVRQTFMEFSSIGSQYFYELQSN